MISRPVQIAIGLMLAGVLATGLFMLHLRQREIEKNQRTSDSRPVTAPVSGPKEAIRLAIAYDNEGVLRREDASSALPAAPADRAREIVRLLLAEYMKKASSHQIAEGSDVKDIFLLKDGLCVVDMNSAFAEGHRSGIMVEELTIASLVETLAINMPSIRRVKFLVEGHDRETLAGHADLRLTYEVASVHELVAELQ
jgi:hypothetical protein